MRQLIIIPVLLITLYSCGQVQKENADYPLQVGDIPFDAKKDDPNFKLCDATRVLQYYNFGKGLQYKGEKPAINEYFKNGFKPNKKIKDSGLITIRFIVNCKGEPGRFRIQEMSEDYAPEVFSKDLTSQLLSLVKKMDGWVIGTYEGIAYDYYQYLTFKIQDGQLMEILP